MKEFIRFTFPQVVRLVVIVVGLTLVIGVHKVRPISGAAGPTVQAQPRNVALASEGATVVASSTLNANFPAQAAINGDRKGTGWGAGTGGWNDASEGAYSLDWVQVNFNGSKSLNQINVFTLRDGFDVKTAEPTLNETFSFADNTGFGIRDFDVQYAVGYGWKNVPGGAVRGNINVWRRFIFSTPITTTAIRVSVHRAVVFTSAPVNYSRIVEIEAYEGVTSNLAVGKIATQSSTAFGGSASRAVDGNTNGNFFNNSVTHTDGANQPWWQVDLGAVHPINEVRLWNRTDCCPERLSNFYVLVSPQPFTSTDLATTLNQPGVSSYHVPGQAELPLTIPACGIGRYVRLQLAGMNFLSLAEVEVVGGINVARPSNGGSAIASSQISANYPAAGVTDGERKGRNWGNGGGWNDATENQYASDWLQVNFNTNRRIDQINVFTLRDDWQSRTDEPTVTETFNTADNTGQGITDFDVEIFFGGRWQGLGGGDVTENNNVWRPFLFVSITASAIRVTVRNAAIWTTIPNNYSRIVEIEAWGVPLDNPSNLGQFGSVIPLPITPVHVSVLPNGNLLFWSRDKDPNLDPMDHVDPNERTCKAVQNVKEDIDGGCQAYVWDVATSAEPQSVPNPTTNLFCSGHSFMPDGRLLVTGGHDVPVDSSGTRYPEKEGAGESKTNIFDFRTNSWSSGPTMQKGRWYPFNVTLSTGETAIVGGSYRDFIGPFVVNKTAEIYSLNGTQSGGLRLSATDPFLTALYPFLHLASDGRVFMASVSTPLTLTGTGDEKVSRFLDITSNEWELAQGTNHDHLTGTAVMYDDGKVLIAGGRTPSGQAEDSAEIIDLQDSSLNWTSIQPMNRPRMHCTLVLLPDGKVLVAGGTRCPGGNSLECSNGAIKEPEIWDPTTGPTGGWHLMAPHQEVRVYHSVALLLPDARVLVGGGGLPSAVGECPGRGGLVHALGHSNVEIFSPPYLFNYDGSPATRPAITGAPSAVNYGQSFFIGTSAQSISRVAWIRLPSVTHGFNQDQRINALSFAPTAGGVNVTAPSDPRLCPPGHYMLFIFEYGVPSVAKIIQIPGVDTIGLFRPSNTAFYLANQNAAGGTFVVPQFGAPSDIPIVGDWDGNGTTTIGVFRPGNNNFYLRNSNASGLPDVTATFGAPGDLPIVGDWDGNGTTTIGLYRPSNNTFYLRNSNTGGVPDITVPFGAPNDIPIAGDWDGDGDWTIGLYRPGNATFYLRNSNTSGFPDLSITFGTSGDIPITGDWDGNGTSTIGLYRQSDSTFYLSPKNDPAAVWVIPHGTTGDRPIVGNWGGGQ